MSFSKILVPVDGSTGADKAVRFAADLAEATGATLTFLHVYDASAVAIMGMSSLSGAEVDAAIERVSRSYLDQARKLVDERRLEIRTAAKVGHAAEEIVEYAKNEGVDLVVMGSRGMTTFKGLLIGSVSDQVVHHSPCPVTVVR